MRRRAILQPCNTVLQPCKTTLQPCKTALQTCKTVLQLCNALPLKCDVAATMSSNPFATYEGSLQPYANAVRLCSVPLRNRVISSRLAFIAMTSYAVTETIVFVASTGFFELLSSCFDPTMIGDNKGSAGRE